uniref:Uncharacterized protein n=1 Tax=Anguilla anguilla TaxID=7936 RepID=A0A0E9XJP1_ANGAN
MNARSKCKTVSCNLRVLTSISGEPCKNFGPFFYTEYPQK